MVKKSLVAIVASLVLPACTINRENNPPCYLCPVLCGDYECESECKPLVMAGIQISGRRPVCEQKEDMLRVCVYSGMTPQRIEEMVRDYFKNKNSKEE